MIICQVKKSILRIGRISAIWRSLIQLFTYADIFSKILLDSPITGSENELSAINTLLGYVLMGKHNQHSPETLSFFCDNLESSIDSTIKKIWEIESVPACNALLSPEDEKCENQF